MMLRCGTDSTSVTTVTVRFAAAGSDAALEISWPRACGARASAAAERPRARIPKPDRSQVDTSVARIWWTNDFA